MGRGSLIVLAVICNDERSLWGYRTEINCVNFTDTGISTQADDETEYEGEGQTPIGPPPTETEKKLEQDKKIVKKKKKKKK